MDLLLQHPQHQTFLYSNDCQNQHTYPSHTTWAHPTEFEPAIPFLSKFESFQPQTVFSRHWGVFDPKLGTLSLGESLHCALLLDYVPPKGPLGMPLGNTLRIRQPKLDSRGPSRFLSHGEGPWAFRGELDCVLGNGDGGQSGGETELGTANEMDSILHCQCTTLIPSW